MGNGWRYLAERLTGDGTMGEMIHLDLPLEDVEITEALSAPDAISGNISPVFASLRDSTGRPLLQPWKTAIYAEADGVIRAGGILVGAPNTGHQLRLDCMGFGGYPSEMPYADAYIGVEVDPLDVYRQIWNHLQSQPGGNLGMRIPGLKTGLKIGTELEQVEFDTESGPVSFEAGPVQYAWHRTHDLGAEIDTLAEDTPFDWREKHAWVGDEIWHFMDLGYPRLGSRRDDLRFVIGENIMEPPEIDGGEYADEVLVLGAGEGATMRRGTARRRNGGLRRVAVVTDSTRTTPASAQSLAEAEVARRSGDGTIAEFTMRDTPNAPVGALDPGDEILVEGHAIGWRDLEVWCRVTGKTTRPANAGEASISVIRSDRISS